MIRHHHNFLRAKPAVKRRLHPVTKAVVTVFVVLAVVICFVMLVVAPFWIAGERAYAYAEDGKRESDAAQGFIADAKFSQAATDAADAAADFTSARNELRALLLFSSVPYVGPRVVAADRLLSSGESAAVAAHDVLGIASGLTDTLKKTEGLSAALHGSLPDAAAFFKQLTPAQKHGMLAAFSSGVPSMQDAIAKTDAALASLDQIPRLDVAPPVAAQLTPLRAKLVTLQSGLQVMLPLAEIAPSVLGYPDEKHYLFFFQNDTELRPTGGFLGVYGLATVKDASVSSFATDDVYALDGPADPAARPPAPAPIQRYLGVAKWYLRDANWSPDFTVSSSLMAQFFVEEYAEANKIDVTRVPAIDGIVTVDTRFARDVLAVTGPITVGGKTYDADNVVDQLEFAVEKGYVQQGLPSSERKDVVGALAKAVLARLGSMPLATLTGALGTLQKDLDEKHVLIAMRDPALDELVLEKNWGGKLKPVAGDYLSVIDANLASLKTDPSVSRSVAYSITPQKDGTYLGSVKITYVHHGQFDWKTTRYRTYARVYVPAGTKFVSVVGAMRDDKIKDPGGHPGTADVTDELRRESFGAFISVEPGETKTLEFRFLLAPSVVQALKNGAYHLDVEKQPGTEANGLTLDLDFGKKLTSAQPAEAPKEWGDTHYRISTDLRVDRTFDVGF
jgi:hypothetical protein